MLNQSLLTKHGKPIIIREAIPQDAEAVIQFVKEVLPTTEFVLTQAHEFNYTVEEEALIFEKTLQNPNAIYLLAIMDGEIVGNLGFLPNRQKRIQHWAELGMTILKDYRNMGIGAALLKVLIKWAIESPGIEKVCLSVRADNNRAIHLYTKLGFEQEGTRKKAIKMKNGDYFDLIEMALFVK